MVLPIAAGRVSAVRVKVLAVPGKVVAAPEDRAAPVRRVAVPVVVGPADHHQPSGLSNTP